MNSQGTMPAASAATTGTADAHVGGLGVSGRAPRWQRAQAYREAADQAAIPRWKRAADAHAAAEPEAEPIRRRRRRGTRGKKRRAPVRPPEAAKGKPVAPVDPPAREPAVSKEAATPAPAAPTPEPPAPASAETYEATDLERAVAQAAGIDLSDALLRGRLKAAIDARLRGVRNAYETRARLEGSTETGGLGIAGEPLVRAVETLEQEVASRLQAAQAEAAQAKQASLEAQRGEADARDAALASKEEALLARRYVEMTGKAPVAPIGGAGARVSAAHSRERELAKQEGMIDAGRVRQAVDGMNAARAATPRLSPGSIPAPEGRPRVQDVRFERRLMGPVEELGGMTLAMFRRLADDPQAAAGKIRDKADLLGIEDRINAVKAWRTSPINQAYLALTQASLASGKPIPALIAERTQAGEETLTAEEVSAIVALNADLRF